MCGSHMCEPVHSNMPLPRSRSTVCKRAPTTKRILLAPLTCVISPDSLIVDAYSTGPQLRRKTSATRTLKPRPPCAAANASLNNVAIVTAGGECMRCVQRQCTTVRSPGAVGKKIQRLVHKQAEHDQMATHNVQGTRM